MKAPLTRRLHVEGAAPIALRDTLFDHEPLAGRPVHA
jgi:hypothetical protein